MIRLDGFSFTYVQASQPALQDLRMALAPGAWLWLAGPAGGGKSTLLKNLAPGYLAPGSHQGHAYLQGRPLDAWGLRDHVQAVAFLGPQTGLGPGGIQVRDAIATAAHQLSWSQKAIQARLGDLAPHFDLGHLLDRPLSELSQGQARRVALAAAFFLKPDLVLLDDAFDDLDPLRRRDLWRGMKGFQEDQGVTIVTASQDGDLAAYADQVLALEQGRMTFYGPVQEALAYFFGQDHRPYPVPEVAELAYRIRGLKSPIPTTVRQGRHLADIRLGDAADSADPAPSPGEAVLALDRVRFRYRGTSPLLEDVSYRLCQGDRAYLFGSNGAGKSTLLQVMAGFLKAWEGRRWVKDKGQPALFAGAAAAYLREDDAASLIASQLARLAAPAQARASRMGEALGILDLSGHPFDLSAGQQQALALWLVLSRPAPVYLLDEPSAHLDPPTKAQLVALLTSPDMASAGILMTGHDRLFAAQACQRAGLLFDGAIVADGPIADFFSRMSSYTTDTARLFARRQAQIYRPDQVRRQA